MAGSVDGETLVPARIKSEEATNPCNLIDNWHQYVKVDSYILA
jgi:hypothetical protein